MWIYILVFAVGAGIGYFLRPNIIVVLLCGFVALLIYEGIVVVTLDFAKVIPNITWFK